MDYVYVLKGTHYVNWSEAPGGGFEVHDEETYSSVVSAHSSPSKAAEAAIEYIGSHEPDEDRMEGPLERLWLYRVALDPEDPAHAASGALDLGSDSDEDARRAIREKVLEKFGR